MTPSGVPLMRPRSATTRRRPGRPRLFKESDRVRGDPLQVNAEQGRHATRHAARPARSCRPALGSWSPRQHCGDPPRASRVEASWRPSARSHCAVGSREGTRITVRAGLHGGGRRRTCPPPPPPRAFFFFFLFCPASASRLPRWRPPTMVEREPGRGVGTSDTRRLPSRATDADPCNRGPRGVELDHRRGPGSTREANARSAASAARQGWHRPGIRPRAAARSAPTPWNHSDDASSRPSAGTPGSEARHPCTVSTAYRLNLDAPLRAGISRGYAILRRQVRRMSAGASSTRAANRCRSSTANTCAAASRAARRRVVRAADPGART